MQKPYSSQVEDLRTVYSIIYSTPPSSIQVNSAFLKHQAVTINGKCLGSYKTRRSASSIVLAAWTPCLFGLSDTASCVHEDRPIRINFFAKHSVVFRDTTDVHLLVCASWFKHHPRKSNLGKPVSVWECDLFETSGTYSTVPVQLIRSRTVTLIDTLDGMSAMFVTPCIDF